MPSVVRCAGGLGIPFLIVALATGEVLGQESITLDEAIALAVERSPTLAQSEATLVNAEWGRRTAVGSFFPSVSLSSGASVQSQNRFDPNTQTTLQGSEDSYSASLSASYNLFSGGRRFFDLSGTGATLTAARATYEDQRNQIVLQTKSVFFNALRQADLLVVAQARVRRAQESLDMIRRQVQVGSATRSDTLRARLELANAQQAVLQAENADRSARFSLGRQVGLARPVVASPPDDLDPRPLALSEEEILSVAEEASPMVRSARAETEAALFETKSARGALMPSLNLSSGYGWNNDDASLSGGRTSWSLRLSLSYPIFNGLTREATVQRASDAARVARLRETDVRIQARQEADAALQNVLTAEQAIDLAGESVLVAEEDLRIVSERYRVGVATILDLITSQIAVQEAESGLVTARFDYAVARAELIAITGREL